jgi:nucleoside 2-deoxyribosyltransferase
MKTPLCGEDNWFFFCEPSYKRQEADKPNTVNLAEIRYPNTLSERVDRILLNLHRVYPEYSWVFPDEKRLARALFAETEVEESTAGFLNVMVDLGYLTRVDNHNHFRINAEGLKRIEELTSDDYSLQQGFIAMRFSEETDAISKAFETAIVKSGYSPMRIDHKEHNNQIVPEILYEIRRSKFLVLDVTHPNNGAYYEAGYALGKGKQVIVCCRKNEFDSGEKPHFDILQQSMIIWESEEELVERLVKRIQATVQ